MVFIASVDYKIALKVPTRLSASILYLPLLEIVACTRNLELALIK